MTADALDVDQTSGEAIFTGNVLIAQGDMRLTAPRVLVVYDDGNRAIQRMEATGGVTLVSGPDAAEAQEREKEFQYDMVVSIIEGYFINLLFSMEEGLESRFFQFLCDVLGQRIQKQTRRA